jgi:hypothetical protein
MSPNERQRRGQRAAARHLRVLLLKQGAYRDRWEAYAHDIIPGEISQSAVCQVIAQHLWDKGERSEGDVQLPRKLKDRISRALTDEDLSLETLRWLVAAFRLSPHDAQRVYELYRAGIGPRIIVGDLPPRAGQSGIRAPVHQTALLFEHHYIGSAGLPVRHHTQQTLFSLVDGLESYRYGLDTLEAEVRVMRGGTASEIYPTADAHYVLNIMFPHPLHYGEEHYLDYWTLFHYSQPPPPEFRRATHQRVEHLEMRVEFHPRKLPGRLWWAQWRDYRDVHAEVTEREIVPLDEELSARRYLDAVERAVVGFYWEWLGAPAVTSPRGGGRCRRRRRSRGPGRCAGRRG